MNVVDFFCGCGGTSLGFAQAGMNVAIGIDLDESAGATFAANFPHARFLHADVRTLRVTDLRRVLPARPWVFSGCAPCQPFSKQNGMRSPRDERRTLLDHFGRFVGALLPDYVFIENVPGLQRVGSGGPFARFRRVLRDKGYHVTTDVVPALWFGVPQLRERLVLMASRNGPVLFPESTHGVGKLPYSTVREWIGDLPSLQAGQAHPQDPVHRSSALSAVNLERIIHTREGGGRESWPARLQLECHRNHGGHSDVYGRLAWDRPAAGLTTRCISLSNGRYGHPVQHRALSAREAACLQTFPMSYAFVGTLTAIARQIGNAVPPLMARRFGEQLMQHCLSAAHNMTTPRNRSARPTSGCSPTRAFGARG